MGLDPPTTADLKAFLATGSDPGMDEKHRGARPRTGSDRAVCGPRSAARRARDTHVSAGSLDASAG